MPRLQSFVRVAFVTFSALDVLHYITNEVWPPFAGPADGALHLLYGLGTVVGGITLVAAGAQIVTRLGTSRYACTPALAALVLTMELACSLLLPVRDVGASSYRPLFPDFFAGALVAVTSVSATRSLLHLRRFRWSAAVMVAGWVSTSLLVDALWWTEGGARGTGPVWTVPVIDQLWPGPALLAAGTYEAARGLGGWVWGCVGAGVLMSIVAAPRSARAQGLLHGLCWAFLVERLADWGNFILD